MRSLDPQKIAALALAVLLLAGGVALVHFRIPQTDFSMLDDSNVALTPHSPRAAKSPSHAEAQQLAIARTAAGQVDLAAIPDLALPPKAPARHPAPPPPAPQTKAPAPSQFTLSAHDLDLAFHPSHKYKPSLASGADQVALASFGPSPSAPDSAAAPGDATKSEGRLIDANLKLEEDRRFVMSMCEDHQGRLWVGSEEDQPGTGGVQCFDPSAPPLHQWKKYTVADGLGDNNGYALACDHEGRIWVGHLNHGVSVFNGQKWQNYEVVGGLSRPDTLSGPIGERIFHITVCPQLKTEAVFTDSLTGKQSGMSGSVWMCTSAGLSIYFPSTDSWSYLTRADGLPSDQANSLAFTGDGTVYLATQCDGIAIAQHADGYKRWRTVTGPGIEPAMPSGDGLPTSLINDVLVASDGAVYAATDAGLAWSGNQGQSWHFVRGKDWAAKVRGRIVGPPNGWHELPTTPSTLAEDYCTCLAEDPTGGTIVGHRAAPIESWRLRSSRKLAMAVPDATSRCALLGSNAVAGTYGHGVLSIGADARPKTSIEPRSDRSMPASAAVPGLATLNQILAELSAISDADGSGPLAVALEDDWATQGAWLGRKGRYWSVLSAMSAPDDYLWGAAQTPVRYAAEIGSSRKPNDSLRYWIAQLYSKDPRFLEMPPVYLDSRVKHGYTTRDEDRRQASWDDHGEVYAETQDGPGIHCDLEVPAGAFILSLYEINDDGHSGSNGDRNFSLQIQAQNNQGSDASTKVSRTGLTSSRAADFFGGVYKRFLVEGPSSLVVTVGRNHSRNTTLAALMLDPPDGRMPPYPSTKGSERPKREPEGTNWAPCASELQAVAKIEDGLTDTRTRNRRWWAMNNRQISVELGRWCQINVSRGSPTEEIALEAASLYQCQLYPSWENCEQQLGQKTARQVEHSLRWDGIHRSYSGREFGVLSASVPAGKLSNGG